MQIKHCLKIRRLEIDGIDEIFHHSQSTIGTADEVSSFISPKTRQYKY